MQPRLQKGACSGLSGFPHSEHFFGWLEVFGISARHGEGGVSAQLDPPADLPGKSVEPVAAALDHGYHRRGSHQALRACRLERRATQQGAGLEAGPVLSQLYQ